MPLFVSYAREDAELKDELLAHLAGIEVWHDANLQPGQAFDPEIRTRLETAEAVLLLVSADFLASRYCAAETAIALAGPARVIPILLRDCDWSHAPFASLHAVPGKPVTSWANRDEAFAIVARHIRAEAPESLPVSISNLPPRNPNFTGRVDLLAKLHEALASEQKAALQALAGMGGVGKTQLANEYAHAHASDYSILWWIRSEQPTTLASDFASLAEPLRLRERTFSDQGAIVAAVRKYLSSTRRWLLIFDNVGKPEDVKPYLPDGGHVIVTSRHQAWRGVAKPIEIDVMHREDAIAFLLQRTGTEDRDAANALAGELGDLPLALDQAGAYIESTGETLAGYVGLFRTRREELWKEEAGVAERTVTATLQLSLGKLEKEALLLLGIFAFLAPEEIPRSLVDGVFDDKLQTNRLLASLRAYSLIQVTGESISLHRLVQYVMRDSLDGAQQKSFAQYVLATLFELWPATLSDPRSWPATDRLLPHAEHAIRAALAIGALDVPYFLLSVVGYLRIRDADAGARELLAIAEQLRADAYPTDADLLRAVRTERAALYGKDDSDPAVLAEYEALLASEPDGADRADLLVGMADALLRRRRHAEAVEPFRAAIEIFERLDAGVPTDHRGVAKANLAVALFGLGEFEAAAVEIEGALQLFSELYGPENARIIPGLRTLANIHLGRGDAEAAMRELRRALEIQLRLEGEDHPRTAEIRAAIAKLTS